MKRFSRLRNKVIRVKPVKRESLYRNNSKEKINELTLNYAINVNREAKRDTDKGLTAKNLVNKTKNAYVVVKTPGQRVRDSRSGDGNPIISSFQGITPKGVLYFETNSQTNENFYYDQYVELVNLDEVVSNYLQKHPNKEIVKEEIEQAAKTAINGNVRVYCNCVKEGTWIKTSKGWKTIETINTDDYVLSSDGQFHKVYGLLKRDVKEKTKKFSFTMENIPFELEVTGNHSIYIHSIYGKKIKFEHFFKREARSLKKNNSFLSSYPYSDIKKKESIGKKEARCLGLFFGNGFCFEDKICITVIQKKKIPDVIQSLKKTFNDIELDTISESPINKESFDVVVKSKKYFDLCNKYIDISDYQRKLSPDIYKIKKNELIEFLYGMSLSIGVSNIQINDICLHFNKQQHVLETKCLLNAIGFDSLFCKKTNNEYMVHLNINLFANCIKNLPLSYYKNYKNIRAKKYCSVKEKYKRLPAKLFLENFVSKKEIKDEANYYDISLLDEPHDYMANGVFVSNCPAYLYWGWQYLDWKEGAGLTNIGFNGDDITNLNPKIRNPKEKGRICKHLWSVLTTKAVFSQNNVSEVIKEKIKEAKKVVVKSKTQKEIPEKQPEKQIKEQPEKQPGKQIKEQPEKEEKKPIVVKNKSYKGKDFSKYEFIPGSSFVNCNFNGVHFEDKIFDNIDFTNSHFNGCFFTRSVFKNNCNMLGAHIEKANFYKAKLYNSNFKYVIGMEVIFNEAQVENIDFEGSVFNRGSFIGFYTESSSKFNNVSFEDANLFKANLQNSEFKEANFTDVKNMSGFRGNGSNFDDARFIGSSGNLLNLKKCFFEKTAKQVTSFKGTKFSFVNLEGTKITNAEMTGVEIDNSNFKKVDLYSSNMQGANIVITTFEDAKCVGTDFRGAKINKVRLLRTDMSNANIKDVKELSVTEFIEADNIDKTIMTSKQRKQVEKLLKKIHDDKMKNIIYKEKNLNNIVLNNINMNEGIAIKALENKTFNNSRLTDVNFNGCKITSCQFKNAVLEECKFIGSEVIGVNFEKATIHNCDFSNTDVRESDFTDCNFENNNIEGCNITKEQLMQTYNFKEYQKKYKNRFERLHMTSKNYRFERFVRKNFWKIVKNNWK